MRPFLQPFNRALSISNFLMRERPQVILMQPSVIVWDLETVHDLGGLAAANDLVGTFGGNAALKKIGSAT